MGRDNEEIFILLKVIMAGQFLQLTHSSSTTKPKERHRYINVIFESLHSTFKGMQF